MEEKLKTLKDIDEIAVEMNDTEKMYVYAVDKDELKAEAVKIIKWLRKENNYDKHNMYDNILCGLGISWAECSDIEAVINFLKWWLDLTEEDLNGN
jgi:phosphoribosylaminoimidazole (AIR) synthetase